MKKALCLLLVAVVTLAFASTAAVSAEKPMTVKYGHGGPPKPFESGLHAASVAFKYVMEKRSGGKIEVKIYPSGTLGKEVDHLEATKNNVIQVYSASMAALHRIFPPALLGFSPYIFRNEAIAIEVLDGPFGQKLLDIFTEKTGIKGLAIADLYSFMAITNSVRQLRKPDDFKGIKFRGMDTLQVAMFTSLGGSAVPISWTEVYTSLQTGVVQGQTNPPSIISWAKLNEVQKYMTLANSQYGYQWLICNKQWYENLSPQNKLILRDATQAAKETARGLGLLLDDKAIKELKDKGMDVYALSDEEVLALQKIARPACLEWLKKQMDPTLVDEMMKAIEDAEKKLGY